MLDKSQAQVGIFYLLMIPSPFPWKWASLIIDKNNMNLINPFMCITNKGTGLPQESHSYYLIIHFLQLVEFIHFIIQRTRQKSHYGSSFSSYQNA